MIDSAYFRQSWQRRESEPVWFWAIALPERLGRLLMDFGFGSLVDKFEERIGRRPTSALLWLTAVALFVACTRAILLDGVIPLIEFARGVSSESAKSVFVTAGKGALIAALTAFLFVILIRLLVVRLIFKAKQAGARASSLSKRAEKAVNIAQERSDKLVARASLLVDEAVAATEIAKSEREEMVRLRAEIKALKEELDRQNVKPNSPTDKTAS